MLESCSYFIGAKIDQPAPGRQTSNYSSNYDALTGAKNRNALLTAVEELTGGTKSVGVVFVDVNGLKKINDAQGHAAGDEVLRLVARHLSTEYGAGNVYREGGDEFVAILPGIGYDEFAKRQEGLSRASRKNSARSYRWVSNGARTRMAWQRLSAAPTCACTARRRRTTASSASASLTRTRIGCSL